MGVIWFITAALVAFAITETLLIFGFDESFMHTPISTIVVVCVLGCSIWRDEL